MNKAELIAKLADDAGITKTQANAALDSFRKSAMRTSIIKLWSKDNHASP